MGYAVSDRQLHALIVRTIDRDRLAGAWQRLEIFLPDRLRERDSVRVAGGVDASFPELAETFKSLPSSTTLTSECAAFCWRAVVQVFRARVENGEDAGTIKRGLRDYLAEAVPGLAGSPGALKRNLNRKLVLAETAGIGAINGAKGRPAKDASERIPEYEQNLKLLKELTQKRWGNESQAWRELHTGTAPDQQRFTELFREHFPFNPRENKSQVPTIMRAKAQQHYTLVESKLIGGNFARNRTPSIPQKWDGVCSNERHTADDITADLYSFDWCEDGDFEFKGRRFQCCRPQMVPVICDRTDYPLSVSVKLARQPDSNMVFTALTTAWTNPDVGLPHEGAKLERGVFAALKVLALFDWPSIDQRFIEREVNLNLDLLQANGPRAKSAIERFAKRLHSKLNHLPGYCGNNERVTCPERLRKFLASLKRVGQPLKAEVDPREMLLSLDQFNEQVKKACSEIAVEPQCGKRLRGMSPAEAWKAFASAKPTRLLPDSLRYLLCSQRRERAVTSNGIRIPFGKWDHRTYFGSERLGEIEGQKVEVYYNPDLPEQIICIHRPSDPRGVNPFSVPLLEELRPNGAATKEDFQRAAEHTRKFLKARREACISFAPPSSFTIRNERMASPDARQRGNCINALEREHIDLNTSRDLHRGEIGELAALNNLEIDPSRVKRPARVAESLRRATEAEERALAAEAAEDREQEPAGVLAVASAGNGEIAESDRKKLFALMGKISPGCPKEQRDNITRRVLGYAKRWGELTRGEWGKLMNALNDISKRHAK